MAILFPASLLLDPVSGLGPCSSLHRVRALRIPLDCQWAGYLTQAASGWLNKGLACPPPFSLFLALLHFQLGPRDWMRMEDIGRHEAFSADGSWSPQPPRVGRAPTKSRTVSVAAAAKITAKARACRGSSKAEERTVEMRQKALTRNLPRPQQGRLNGACLFPA